MLKKYSTTASLKSLERYVESIEEFLRRVDEEYGLRVAVVFGSHARGDATQLSDVDMILVCRKLPDGWLERLKSVGQYAKFPIQALAYTVEELEEAVRRPCFAILDAILEGVPLVDDGTWEKVKRVYSEIKEKYSLRKEGRKWRFNPKALPY
ncbi:MAG: nucleotidyltransferase domain-containing protein [Candidatus Jordarchaeales archaeon]